VILLQLGFGALLLIFANQTAWGQNRKSNTNTTQAVLHLQATVAPVVVSANPSNSSLNHSNGIDVKDVSYRLAMDGQHVSVSYEVRPLLAIDGIVGARGMLKTTTVVPE
jgi:hypothetical protein